MRTKEELSVLRERAVALRLAGKSLREIKQALGPMSNTTLHDALRDTPPPAWTRRPNAKDDIKAQARELRAQGLAYHEIAARLGVSKSSVSLWVRDLPVPETLSYAENRRRSAEGVRQYWAKERELRGVLRAGEVAAAAADIGDLTDREIIVAGAIAYWCEGSKRKPPYNFERVVFINSDPRLILFFLRFLAATGVQQNDLAFCVHIHETADVEAAQRFWQEVTGAPPSQFKKPTLKRHNPKTNRKNVGEGYHGCLKVYVLRSNALYRKIEGWAAAAMASNLRTQARVKTRTHFLLPGEDSNLR
ncbi:MAG TPA: helix-turn-helix domain-containing protein [Trebonia sp.]|nr:helix-turn-helix domain-containing protein [Trebonia sp.]